MAIAETAARKLLRGGAIAGGVADVGGISFGLWDLVTGFFANILSYLFAALAGVAHLLVLPLELLWHWLVTLITNAAGAIASGLDGLWQHVTGFFAGIFAGLASAAHQLVLPLETLWRWLVAIVADAAGAIGSGLDGLWQLVAGFFPKILAHILAAVSGAAHEIPAKLEVLWRWLKAAAVVAFPFVVGVAVVLLLVALVWFWGPALCAAGVGACQALVYAFCYLGNGVFYIAVSVGGALSRLVPPCAQCLHLVTMRAPGAAGMVISRAAFVANPALYFQILRAAGPVVAAAVYCTKTVAGHGISRDESGEEAPTERLRNSAKRWRILGVDVDDIGGIFSGLWQIVKAKAAEVVAYLAALFAALGDKVDELFPPETRSETLRQWLHVAVTVVLPAALGALVLLCVARCCWRCCCGRARGGGRRMMAAPGRGGARMPRGVFESNPRGYFRDLRAQKPLVY
nr:unnamed protein product [Digitaria exilis]